MRFTVYVCGRARFRVNYLDRAEEILEKTGWRANSASTCIVDNDTGEIVREWQFSKMTWAVVV